MKICMLNQLFHPFLGGTEKVILEVVKRLKDKHEFHILTAQLPNTQFEETFEGVHIHRLKGIVFRKLPPPLPPPYAIIPSHIFALKKMKDIDIFHMHNRFTYNLGTIMTIKNMKKKSALTIHNCKVEGISPLTDFCANIYDSLWGRSVINSVTGVTAVSQHTLDVTVPEKSKKKARVIYNGVNKDLYFPDENAGNEIREKLNISDPIILCDARFIPQKGHVYLLNALTRISDAHLLLIGRGPLKNKMMAYANKMGLKNRVHFAPENIPEQDMPKYYNACDVFALPTLYEPFGLVIAQAMACEKPVVSTSVCAVPEVVGHTGVIVPPRNPFQLSSAIAEILNDQDLAKQLGKNARKRVEDMFDWDKIALQYDEFYTSLL